MYSSAALVCPAHSERKQNAARQQGYGGEAENVLVVHGDEDKVVPHSHGVKLAKMFGSHWNRAKVEAIPASLRRTQSSTYTDALVKFFRARLAKGRFFVVFFFLVTFFTTRRHIIYMSKLYITNGVLVQKDADKTQFMHRYRCRLL